MTDIEDGPPDALPLESIVPLAFIAILFHLVEVGRRFSRLSSSACWPAGGSLLPSNTGIIVAAVGGTIAGDLFANREET